MFIGKSISNMVKVYVINLKTSTDRKQYIEQLLSPYQDFMDVHFVEAVDGRGLSDERLSEMWNQKETYKTYGRYMKGGEIGCSLSHRKCYEEILKNGDDAALILEDDVVFKENTDIRKVVSTVEKLLCTQKPMIVLLSGSYWFFKEKSLPGVDFQLASVFEAMGTMSYMMNQAAAKRMTSIDKKYLADDWYHWRTHGINVYAVRPHIAGDFDLFGSVIADREGWKRKNLSFKNKIRAYSRAVIRRGLGRIGHWEKRE